VGSFNGWDAAGHRLARTPDGDWTLTMYLVASRVVYHIDVDEAYWLDPFDHGRLRNGWGVRIFGSLRPPDDNDPSESIRAQDTEDLVQETCLRVAVIALIPDWF